MRLPVIILLLSVLCSAQSVTISNGQLVGGQAGASPALVGLPQAWAQKAHITSTLTFASTRQLGPTATGANAYVCTAGDGCFQSLQQAICDWVNDGTDDSWKIQVQAGTLIQTGLQHTFPGACPTQGPTYATTYRMLNIFAKIISGHLPTGYLVITSTTPLTAGLTVCSHNTDDTGVRQPPSGDISTWWSGTNYGCANDIGSMWTLEGNWTPGNYALLIQAYPWDPTTKLGPSNVIFDNVEMRPINTSTSSVDLVNMDSTSNYGTVLGQLSEMTSNVHFDYDYVHGNATDWCNSVGGVIQYSLAAAGTGYAHNDTGTINTGSGTATYIINTVTSGAVKFLTITSAGSGYSVANNVATSTGGSQPGVGTGLQINILATATSSPSCVTSFNQGGPGSNSISTAISLGSCIGCSANYNYIAYLGKTGKETHCISMNRNPGPVAATHNWCEGQAIALFTGGIAQTDQFYYVQNCEFRGNRATNPPSWVGTPYMGAGLLLKNMIEIKAGQYCVIDGNFTEYTDTSGGQDGEGIELNPRACSAGNQCDNPQVTIADITVTNNLIRHALTGINIDGHSGYPANGGGVAPSLRYVNVNNNLMYDIGNQNVLDHLQIVANPYALRQLSSGETFVCSGTRSGTTLTFNCLQGPTGLNSTQIQVGDYVTVTNCTNSDWNIPTGNFPFTPGPVALQGTVAGGLTVVVTNASATSATNTNCLISNREGIPHYFNFIHNTIVADSTQGGLNTERIYNGGTQSIFTDTGCTGAGPNNSTGITALSRSGGTVTAVVASLTGWGATLTNANAQTIVEASGLTPADLNGSFYYLGQTSAAVCTGLGGTTCLQWQQAGSAETATGFGAAAQAGTCPINLFAQNNTLKDNLLAVNSTASSGSTPGVGWTGWNAGGDGNTEGCSAGFNANGCSENMFDSASSVVTYTDFPSRVNTIYTEMGGANAGVRPPVTLTFPNTSVCSGPTATATCVGMVGMMNNVAFDGNDPNWQTAYGLVPSSVYHNTADDGTDYGAVLANIEAANQSNQYVCTSPCGSGPFPDH